MDFSRDAALLLVGHGSSHYQEAGRVLHAHAAALQAGGHFAETAVGLLRGTPSVTDALAALTARVVHVVPFFMEDGFFTRVAVPDALAQAERRSNQTWLVCPPVGTHDGLAALIAERVRRHCPDPAVWSVLLVGHGSTRAPGRRMALHRHQARLAATGQFARVRLAFLEEPPLLPDVLAELRGSHTAVIGFFAGEGRHVRDDLPRCMGAARASRDAQAPPLLDLGLISDEPGMRRIILELVGTGAESRVADQG
jgi:sirohydrochlorin cobaltochelatase